MIESQKHSLSVVMRPKTIPKLTSKQTDRQNRKTNRHVGPTGDRK